MKQLTDAHRIGARKHPLIAPCSGLIRYLKSKNDILLLTTSNRYEEHTWDIPKTTQLALRIKDHLRQEGKRVTLLDVAKLKIYACDAERRLKTNRSLLPGRRQKVTL